MIRFVGTFLLLTIYFVEADYCS